MRTIRTILVLLAGVTGGAGCEAEASYVFRPAEQATATLAGHLAARYEVPPESPRGAVRVASFGTTEVETSAGELYALHVRMSLANNNDTGPWQVDTQELRVAYACGPVVGPALVNTLAPGAPEVEIDPGHKVALDAYFPLPRGAEDAARVPRFDLLWKVRTPEREVAERTPFERIRIEPEPATTVSFGLGAAWWYDPLFFPGPPVIVQERPRVFVVPPR